MIDDVWRELERPAPESVTVGGIELRAGCGVRMHPADRRDILSAALDGRAGIIESIEELIDGGIVVAVSPYDDPGRDLGPSRPGARFFFRPDELEPVARILIAGVGNMFLGDDGFGCEVARRLASARRPGLVDVVDFGIRGFDLAYALASGHEVAILIDAAPLGEPPGTLALVEAQLDDGAAALDTHGMDPVRVLRLARELGNVPVRTLVLACQPARVADADAGEVLVELSPVVEQAVERAVAAVAELVADLLQQAPERR